jgi:hypothetical protein
MGQGFVVLSDEHYFSINDKDIPVSVDTIDKTQASDLFPPAWLPPSEVRQE